MDRSEHRGNVSSKKPSMGFRRLTPWRRQAQPVTAAAATVVAQTEATHGQLPAHLKSWFARFRERCFDNSPLNHW
ncbi:hypothetical protein LX32DRAFT_446237 [Colletotrichum zoysiae]|uniref:Uncharacterized protein n=1 Tax=Colletotrichum zoysiae TaxID=1216348 RepID=A0AAD9HG25_9PEZI|nr:hypothetical protein LX32DRAFT_446237 [Colletotrichum zoysiae]